MFEIVYSDSIGESNRDSGPFLRDYEVIPSPLRKALMKRLGQDCRLTPIQLEALEAGICTQSSHYIVSAPTNSGKTLVAGNADLIRCQNHRLTSIPITT